MKIKKSQGEVLNVSIQKKGGNIVLMAESVDRGCRIEGKVVKATKHEIELLKELLKSSPSIAITVDDDFIA